jgi:membrane-bound lytic murein transglycosylase MltF
LTQTRERNIWAKSGKGAALFLLALFFPPVEADASTKKTELSEPVEKFVLHKDDFDGIEKRRVLRVLVPYSKTFFFFDGPEPRGLTHDWLRAFEKSLNKGRSKKALRLRIAFIPTPRDKLLPDLVAGKGDIAAGNLTITPERLKLVDFSNPIMKNVQEILVTHKSEKSYKDVSALSGKIIHVRKSSSYFSSLEALNAKFKQQKKKPVKLELENDLLEDEDLMAMVSSRLIPALIVDRHKAELWAKVYKNLKLHPKVIVREGGNIGWAFRKNSPLLAKKINAFVKTSKEGTLLGNVMINKYLKSTKIIRQALDPGELEKVDKTTPYFRKTAKAFNLDWLLLMAQGYQESGLDQRAKSHAGAVGIMQMLPSTAADPNVGIPNIKSADRNIQAGGKYLRFIMDQYFGDAAVDPFDQQLLALASYNAGPARVQKLRHKAKKQNLNPNKWFQNVEYVAARDIGRETVDYVFNVYLYYTVYRRAKLHALELAKD